MNVHSVHCLTHGRHVDPGTVHSIMSYCIPSNVVYLTLFTGIIVVKLITIKTLCRTC